MSRSRRPTPAAPAPGDAPVRFINQLTHTGDFSGVPFALRPWQESLVRRLLGTLRPDGTRQYRKAFLALPRKQGKTELAAAILLYLLLGTGRKGQQIYSASGDRAQASLIFRAAAAMVRADPYLAEVCLVYDGYKRIVCEPLDSFYEALSSDAPRKHGLGPAAVLFDEVHVLPNRDLHDVLTTGFGARRDPLTLYITTAGWDRHSLCYELWQYAEQVGKAPESDPAFLPMLYAAGPEDDWGDEAVWHRAMPALGDFCSLEFLRDEYRKAKDSPLYENTFKQLYLNMWTEQAQRWLSTDRWKECGTLDPETLAGRTCYAGLDLGVTGDMSALALAFVNELGGVDLLCRFWVPIDGTWRQESRNKDLYKLWEKRGFLAFTEGKSANFTQIEREIGELHAKYPFKMLLGDRAFARQILGRLAENHGIEVCGLPQGAVTLNEPMVRLEAMMLDGTLRHAANPVLAWNVANATVNKSDTGLIHLVKSGTTFRIDGLAAVIDAMKGLIDDPAAGILADDAPSLVFI